MGLNERKDRDHFDPPMALSPILGGSINHRPERGGRKEMIEPIAGRLDSV